MASFADYTEFVEPLRLPYRGKTYEIPAVGIQDTIRLGLALDAAAAEVAGAPFDPEQAMTDEEFDRLLLGDALEQMRADNVPPDFVRRVLKTAVAEFRNGRDYAHMVWSTDGSPKAMAEWIRTHEDSQPSNDTGEANETPKPASTTGTRTSPSKPPRSKAKAPASRRGPSSSASGSSSKRTSTPSTASTSTPQGPSGQ